MFYHVKIEIFSAHVTHHPLAFGQSNVMWLCGQKICTAAASFCQSCRLKYYIKIKIRQKALHQKKIFSYICYGSRIYKEKQLSKQPRCDSKFFQPESREKLARLS